MSDEYRPQLTAPEPAPSGRIYSEGGRLIVDPPGALAWIRCQCGAPAMRSSESEVRCADENCAQILLTAYEG